MRSFAKTIHVLALTAVVILLFASSTQLSGQSYYQDRPRSLSGYWSFELDRSDSGVDQKWFTRRLRDYVQLPGVLQSQFRGDEITVNTPWVLSLYDRFWYLRQEYKDYAERNVKVPFLSQPPRHYLGVAWYQRDIEVPSNWAQMSGVVLMPRQNHREHEGEIREFSIQISDDGSLWSDIARGELPSTFDLKPIEFSRPVSARYLKLVALSGYGTDKTTSLAELAIMYAGPKLDDSGKPMEYQRNRSATPDIDEGPGVEKPKATPTPRARPW